MDQKNNISHFTPLAKAAYGTEIDRLSQSHYSLSAEVLMETAGALSAKEILFYLKEKNYIDPTSSSVMILCGPGHNGGDGLVVARHLLSEGVCVKIFSPEMTHSPLVKKQKKRLEKWICESQKQPTGSIFFQALKDIEKIKEAGAQCSLIVDAIFGIGLIRPIEGFYADLIKWANLTGKSIISLDTPSGLNVDTGQIKGEAIRARLTITFGLAKPGFYLMDGPAHTGKLKVLSIGFPPVLLHSQTCTQFLITESWVSSKLPRREPADHKAQHGHLLVLAGSEGFWGAGQLAALSAYRMGAGYVTWAGKNADASSKFSLNKNIPEVLTQDLSDPDLLKKKTAVLIGPGFGVDGETKKILLSLRKTGLPVVVDADAFTVCIRENLFPVPSHWVLTPHSGELARLFNITGKQIDRDRCSYAIKASQQTGGLVLLKGFHSVLARGGKCWIVPTGNAALAKAGTGDVLAGFMGALMARSIDVFSAAAVAAFVHGKLAEEWVSSGRDQDSLMAQDLKDILPVVLQKLRHSY
ncbi:MAG: NAD(P)H-hydrate dehydratase [Bdellovibrionales bacterium]|nr:NAD(P)H-hydrate dehydratase [Bdellovibrionales bacterium]